MNVLVVEPLKAPYEAEIEDLKDMQQIVGGLIQAIYPYETPIALVYGDESKINGLPLNRAVYDEQGSMMDVIAGPFFICGLGRDNFASLSPALMEKYKEQFHMAEIFMNFNGAPTHDEGIIYYLS